MDQLYVHRWDKDTPVREFLRTLDAFVEAGHAHYLWASNRPTNAWQVAHANGIARREDYDPFSVT
ncbi:hypothetical protein GCM10008994_21090 [Halorubrum ejinorense]|uniref:Uncharacterized protein n=1 Tax=Halorubrum ejinorense TaxID=425309 RepID=A0AAV3STK4_9EURY